MGAVYIQARDGAFYRNPILSFPEGFIRFDDTGRPEIVLWVEDSKGVLDAIETLGEVLVRIFGIEGVGLDFAGDVSQGERQIPGIEPPHFHRAVGIFFGPLKRRIPRPQRHEGHERYVSRCKGVVIELPKHQRDAYEPQIPA